MSKFKVGDKVRVVLPGYVGYEYEICDVKMHDGRCGYTLKKDGGFVIGAVWWENELELIKPKNFTKSDLKDGMVVEYRNGKREVVIGSRTMDTSGFISLSDVNDDLIETANNWPRYDIMKVYEVSNKNGLCKLTDIFKPEHLTLIWERESEYKEMTVAEIEKKLGYKVKIVDGE